MIRIIIISMRGSMSGFQVGTTMVDLVAGNCLSRSCRTVVVTAIGSILVIVARSTCCCCCCCYAGRTRSTLFIVTDIFFFTAVAFTGKASAGLGTAIAGKAWAVVIFTLTGAATNTAPFVVDIASTETAVVGIVASVGSCSGETDVGAFVVLHLETSRKHGW